MPWMRNQACGKREARKTHVREAESGMRKKRNINAACLTGLNSPEYGRTIHTRIEDDCLWLKYPAALLFFLCDKRMYSYEHEEFPHSLRRCGRRQDMCAASGWSPCDESHHNLSARRYDDGFRFAGRCNCSLKTNTESEHPCWKRGLLLLKKHRINSMWSKPAHNNLWFLKCRQKAILVGGYFR